MKTMKKLMAMLMMAGMVFAFPACGGDDDDEKIQDPNTNYDNVITEGQWSESGNKLIYTHSFASSEYQEKWIFTMYCVAQAPSPLVPSAYSYDALSFACLYFPPAYISQNIRSQL